MRTLDGGPLGTLMLVSCALCACSSDASSGSGGTAALLAQAPHCTPGTYEVRIEGNVGDGAIADTRTTNSNAGLSQLGTSEFKTPFTTFATLPDSGLAITLDWAGTIAFGQTAPVTSGNFTLPVSHPLAGQTWCVKQAQIGFVNGGSEDGTFKFAVTSATPNADCTGTETAVDVRGCYD